MNGLNLKITNQEAHFKKGIEATNNLSKDEKRKLEHASKEFESMLTSMMIKSMTKTTDGLFGKDNYGGDVLDVLFETEISKFISDSRGMGVAEKIYKSLTGEELEKIKTISKEKNLNIALPKNNIVSKEGKVETNNPAMKRVEKYNDLIQAASEKYNVDKQLIKSIILTESAGKADAISKANAKGLMQLMDTTATDMGVHNSFNPKENIFGGTKYIAKMLNSFDGDTDLALAAYNAGPGNVKKYGGIPPFKETQNYVNRVKNYLKILE
jgi:Rod binding domain-containing protein